METIEGIVPEGVGHDETTRGFVRAGAGATAPEVFLPENGCRGFTPFRGAGGLGGHVQGKSWATSYLDEVMNGRNGQISSIHEPFLKAS